MSLREMASELGLTPVTSFRDNHDAAITGGYCSDLLSDVIANAAPGNVWVTIQTHRNILAVADFAGLSAIVISGGKQPDQETVSTANERGIVVFSTPLSSFQVAGMIYNFLLVRSMTGLPDLNENSVLQRTV